MAEGLDSVDEKAGPRAFLIGHSTQVAAIGACVLIGAILGYWLLTGEWKPVRRIFAGCVSGAGVGLILTAWRMLR